jgi:hypothetical protein
MTITTDHASGTDKTTATAGELVDAGWKVGAAHTHATNEGAQVFLGIAGGHGTTIRMRDTRERLVVAELLRAMADKIDPQ